jgi:acyl-CoA reductase-like NAD-dependent aldehyde dehydrogenase
MALYTSYRNGLEQRQLPAAQHLPAAKAVGTAVAAARQAQPGWAERALAQRLAVIRRVRQRLATHADALAQCVPGVSGRNAAETLVAEVLPLADACRFLERQAARLLAPQRLRRRGRPLWLQRLRTEIRREPLGVVLIIAPSNYPLFLPGVQTVQALAAGNAVLLKPGQGGTAAAHALADHLAAAGLPAGLLHILSDTPAAAQTAMAAGVDKVLLTGSATTGAAVLAALAPQITPAVLELSGCDAVFVRADADLDLVVPALQFGLRLNGSATCIAPRRVFVAQSLLAELESRLTQMARSMAPCPVHPSAAALAQALVTEAGAAGGRCLVGDFLADGTMTPVVVSAATPAMRLLQADLFAPVLALVPVHGDDDALRAAAQCPYALGAAVFGEETAAHALAQRLRAGVVVVNDVIVPTADPRLPFGGRGRSGFGVTRGAAGLLELTHIKAIAVRGGRWRPHYDPPIPADTALFRAYITAAHGRTLRQRLGATMACVWQLCTRVWSWHF